MKSNSLKFTTVDQYLKYREIISDKVAFLRLSSSVNAAAQIAALSRDIDIADVIIGSAFKLGALEEFQVNGILLDPVMNPGVDVAGFIGGVKQLQLGLPAGGNSDKVIDFKAPTKVVATDKNGNKKTIAIITGPVSQQKVIDMINEKLSTTAKGVPGIYTAVQAYAEASKIDLAKEGFVAAIDKMVTDIPSFINEYPVMKSFTKHVAQTLRDFDHPVTMFYKLKQYFPELPNKEVGLLLEWFTKKYVESTLTSYKTDSERLQASLQYTKPLDGPFVLEVDGETFNPGQTIDYDMKNLKCKCTNPKFLSDIMSDERVRNTIINSIRAFGTEEDKKKISLVKGSTTEYSIDPGFFNRLVNDAINSTSPIKRATLEERRAKKMNGTATTKEYKENSEYSK